MPRLQRPGNKPPLNPDAVAACPGESQKYLGGHSRGRAQLRLGSFERPNENREEVPGEGSSPALERVAARHV